MTRVLLTPEEERALRDAVNAPIVVRLEPPWSVIVSHHGRVTDPRLDALNARLRGSR